MEFKAKDIAKLLNGTVEGDSEVFVNDVSKIEDGRPGTISFLSNLKYEQYIYTTKASIVLVNSDFIASRPIDSTLIRVKSAYEALAELLQLHESFKPKPIGIEQPSFIHESVEQPDGIYLGEFSYISKGVKIGKNVKIHPQVFIGEDTTIGDNTTIFAGVKIYSSTVVGSNCIIHSGAVIGADGFGFAPDKNGNYKKIPQLGNVVIEDDVEIGANSCIDRATMGSTLIKKGVKIDNLVQLAHNVTIGENTVMAAMTGVAGSTKIGANCMFGGQSGVVGHLEIGNNVQVAAQTGVMFNAKDNTTLRGTPAMEIGNFQRSYVLFRKFPDIYNQIREIEKKINNI